jgi:predicted nucleic acid-binding protein
VSALVADASVLADYIRGRRLPAAHRSLVEGPDVIHVPEVCDLEVVSTLRRLIRSGPVALADAAESLGDYLSLQLVRHTHLPLLPRTLSLYANFTAYDAVYVALAEELDAPLLTLDAGLARAVEEHTAVEVVGP